MKNFKNISTEGRNKNTHNIDLLSTIEMVKLLNSEDQKVAEAVSLQLDNIASAIDLIDNVLSNGGRVFYIGAGTSGRLGVLDASEIPPTFNVDSSLFIGIIAGSDIALRMPIENAEDNPTQAQEDLGEYDFNSKDILIGIAASGRTPYVIGGLKYANSIGAKSITVVTLKDAEMSKLSTVAIETVVGAEPITGSTRMKSGTAQKMVLNMISTGAMIKQGKVYGNLMVNVRASNEKLIQRIIDMTKQITGETDETKVVELLKQANYNPKVAIISLIKEVSVDEAKDLLNQNDDILRRVIG